MFRDRNGYRVLKGGQTRYTLYLLPEGNYLDWPIFEKPLQEAEMKEELYYRVIDRRGFERISSGVVGFSNRVLR